MAPIPTATTTDTTSSTARDERFLSEDLELHRAARDLAALVYRGDIEDADLRAQAMRAARSAVLAVAQALSDDRPAIRRLYFLRTDASLHETVAAVDLASAIGALDERRAAEIVAAAARMRGMLRGVPR